MGGLVIEKVRDGVEFIPDAAAAFRRADAQVRAEFGRGIDVNSTYRSWGTQLAMYDAWNAWVEGWGPHPGHSKAVHPSESFHVHGTALDSDDWRNKRIVEILAENGFIRNRLHVPGEDHHFEWLRDRDQNYGKAIADATDSPLEDDDMKETYVWWRDAAGKQQNLVYATGGNGMADHWESSDGAYNTRVASAHNLAGPSAEISEGHGRALLARLEVQRAGKR